jgi:hypothetical protein
MVIVEHELTPKFPSFIWGKDIHVEVGATVLEVSAILPADDEDRRAAHDPLAAYRHANRGMQKRRGKNSSHIQFANADDDQKLIKFIKQFGPVVVSSSRTENRVFPDGVFESPVERTFVVADQNLAELRNERRIYRAALALVAELNHGKKCDVVAARNHLFEIVENVSEWPKQWEREKQMRLSGQGYVLQPPWLFGQDDLKRLETYKYWVKLEPPTDPMVAAIGPPSDPVELGHKVISALVNAFPPIIYPWGKRPVEAPDWDLTGGVRPVLYYILRREYLQAGGIAICRNSECHEVFDIERAGQEFCGDKCSRHQRQREYWNKRGARLRKRRRERRERTGKTRTGKTKSSRKINK